MSAVGRHVDAASATVSGPAWFTLCASHSGVQRRGWEGGRARGETRELRGEVVRRRRIRGR